jgi:hypothetical protein
VRLQLADDNGRQPHCSPSGSRLRRPEEQPALHLRDGLGHGDRAPQQIDPAAAEPGRLPDAEAAVGADEHQRPVARMDDLGHVDDLGWGEKAHLLPLDLGQRHVAAWRLHQVAGVHCRR